MVLRNNFLWKISAAEHAAKNWATAIACQQLNRQFIGCELGKNEFNLATDRLTKHAKNLEN